MKILIADDHRFIVEAVKIHLSKLTQNLEFFHATSTDELDTIVDDALDLAIANPNMIGAEGSAHIDRLRHRYPVLPVIVLSGYSDPGLMYSVLEHGAHGFLPETCPPKVMLAAVWLVLAGGTYVPPMALFPLSAAAATATPAPTPTPAPAPAQVARQQDHRPQLAASRAQPVAPRGRMQPIETVQSERLHDMLTERQIEVLALLSQGKPNKVIGRTLGISEGTVKIHLAAIFRTLNVRNRTEAVIAIQSLTGTKGGADLLFTAQLSQRNSNTFRVNSPAKAS